MRRCLLLRAFPVVVSLVSLPAYAVSTVPTSSGDSSYLERVSDSAVDSTLFSEDFEDGEGDWFPSAGVWQIGAPAVGPDTAYSGTSVAGTVLGGHYPAAAESRLTSPAIDLPGAGEDQSIYLRLWHWFSMGEGDHGVVQISVDAGEWQDVSNAFVGSSGVWTQYLLDLSAYAGSRFRLGFLVSDDGGVRCPITGCRATTGTGWYIDEVSVELRSTWPRNLYEDFESGIGDWFVDAGVWEVGAPTSGPDGAYSERMVAASILDAGYPPGARSRLISPAFAITPSGDGSPQLRFHHWYSMGEGDSAIVQISERGGEWRDVSDPFVSSSGAWTQYIIDLSAFAGAQVRIGFLVSDDGGVRCPITGCRATTGAGWYVDDVRLEGIDGYAISVRPRSIDFGNVKSEMQKNKPIVILNDGTEVFSGSLRITGLANDFYHTGVSSFIIDPGARDTVDVTFAPLMIDSSNTFMATLTIESALGWMDIELRGQGVTEVAFEELKPPGLLTLHPAYPNPVTPSTVLELDLPQPADVTASIFNVLGQEVWRLALGWLGAGDRHEILIGAVHLTSGIYFVRVEARTAGIRQVKTTSVTVLK